MQLRGTRCSWVPSLWALALLVPCNPGRGAPLGTTPLAAPLPGDVDASGAVDIADAVSLLRFLLEGGTPPVRFGSGQGSIAIAGGDSDGNGRIDVRDGLRILQYLFAGGQPPVGSIPGEGSVPFGAPPVTASRPSYRVDVGTRSIEPRLDTPIPFSGPRSEVYIQFESARTAAERASLSRAGIRFFGAIAPHTYLAKIRPAALAQLRADPALLGIEPVRAEDKATWSLLQGTVGGHVVNADGTWSVFVRFYADVSLREALETLDGLGIQVPDRSRLLFNRRLLADVPPGQVVALASASAVRSIEPVPPPPKTDNVTSAQLMNVDDLQAAPFGLDGTGVRIGEWDEAPVRANHPDLTGRVTNVETNGDPGDHSTHVAGTMISSGANNANARGMAPNGTLFSYDFDNGDSTTEQDDAVADNDIVLSNHSWGTTLGWNRAADGTWSDTGNDGEFGNYNGTARDWDALVRSTGLIIHKSSGNDSDDCDPGDATDCDGTPGSDGVSYDTIPTFGNAKNVITVGAINDDGTTIAGFSSNGPADDGRVKPDVVANGVSLTSTWAGGTTIPGGCDGMDYCSIGGTSMSTPSVSGLTALLVERYREEYAGVDPSPDVIKALLVNTAVDLGRPGPDYNFGHGLVDGLACVQTIDVGAVRIITNSVDQDDVDEYLLGVPAGLAALRVTLCWIDPEGAADSGDPDLINNLDVTAIGPDDGTRFPFTGPGMSLTSNATATGPNNLDTVEHLRVTAPQQGYWRIRVRGAAVPEGPQNYALVANASFTLPTEPDMRVGAALDFDDVCPGDKEERRVSIFNIGGADLLVHGVSVASGAGSFSVLPNPTQPFIVKPGAHVDVFVRFAPTSPGPKAGTLRILSNDADEPQLDLPMTGVGGAADVNATFEGSGEFGDVALGADRVLNLEILNQGTCDLTIANVARIDGSSDFTVGQVDGHSPFPIVLSHDAHVDVPIRFRPTSFGPKSATFRISSDDLDEPTIDVVVTGNAPPSDIGVTGSLDFGEVCPGELSEKVLDICNFGVSDLVVTFVGFDPPCDDFEIINNPFPRPVSHDFCVPITVRYTPTEAGDHSCTLKIESNDPDSPVVTVTVTGSTPEASIGVPEDRAFPATVIQPLGFCPSLLDFPISNTGKCLLEITNIEISANPEEYSLVGLPVFPILLEPGHIAGEGDLRLAFAPTDVGRERHGEVSITYVSDGITGETATVTRKLCGEGVKTGARILVTSAGAPVALVEKIQLHRINANRNREAAELDSIDVSLNLTPQSVTPSPPCGSFQYHREFGTVGNPVQLLSGFYQVTATAVVGGKRVTKIVGFNLDTCDFNANIDIDM